ncbi:hypothetical protein Acid345_0076 [Candidatus Koribacter versatilis Ellin345]|uniref:Uncharacterized protein n=2 Tax=Candidatus Korobacter versatilis TaxID=658062 RepID=Q1IVL9_KORVE|nr:hypothetical protein Acid345_0076 [Candidatus Koribacter versatilis Ellin345]
MLAGMIVFLMISAVQSQATPIRPDLQKMIKQSEQGRQLFIPARAGWAEPAAAAITVNPLLESLGGEKLRHDLRDELATIATPDPWIALALVTLILLMRKLRSIEAQKNRARAAGLVLEMPAPEVQRAA